MSVPLVFSARAAQFRPSGVRSVWDVSMQPGMISLAGGSPDLTVLPREEVAELAASAIRDGSVDALQYQPSRGLASTVEAVREVMRAEGVDAEPDRIQITAGSQQAIALVTELLADPGDVILAEAPTYVGALSVFRGAGADVAHVAIDDEGLVPEALAETIARVRATGRRIPFLYTVPTFGNPSGATLSERRRPDVVALCREAGIPIVEDNPYGMLAFEEGAGRRPLYGLDPENVIYLGSFSKIFSPGVRVGWAVAPTALAARLKLVVESTTIHAAVPGQLLAERFITRTDWRAHVRRSVDVYRTRRDALMAGLDAHMPAGSVWTRPEGGFFTFVTLPEDVRSDGLFDAAVEAKVVYVPGAEFMADGSGAHTLRLAYSFEPEDRLAEGAHRLGDAIRALRG